ncbi:uncharacterized protein BDZ99DRAFT_496682 [Mytilinidion resinicola]|uniref:SMODS and SLOG-associating 2TM effector domain-containing protein n=1 Tax=Mytilinidion resinicola TaxID=574789 RepID=A0A6A6YTU3_9PEZI|nr:uncharacterized protein BDZ99DRAFT_496682 [Mytilinidion resinicola]KAF2812191.1 hypothetical protein BDZ99DRAFT_496682 [Mytilinidion resinicola]
MADETTPLLPRVDDPNSIHHQFCTLVGVPPSNIRGKRPTPIPSSLYGRALHRRRTQNHTYIFTATLSNTLLLTQVVLGATLTALGASQSSHVLITIFGVLNTIIAGLVAYLKSRGQPMRARMFRDEMDRVVDEIENSEVMWFGISRGWHGYDEIAIDDDVSVRSEVARLTRLYDKAVRSDTMNDPDMYMGGVGEGGNAALRARPGAPGQPQQPAPPAPVPAPAVSVGGAPAASPVFVITQPPADDPDASPATAPHKKKEDPKEAPKENPVDDTKKEDPKKDDPKPDDAKKDEPKKEEANGTSDAGTPSEGSSKGADKPDTAPASS